MSRLTLGRLIFFTGILIDFIYGIYVAYFSGADTAGYPLVLVAGGVIALAGIVVLFFCGKEAGAEYKKIARQEARKQRIRSETVAERMKFGFWGDWEEFTQIRRLHKGKIEFRNSTPSCMFAALGIFFAAFDIAFFGKFLPYLGLYPGILAAVAGVGVFLIGRGTAIDGTTRKIIRWWGWVTKPIIRYELDLSTIEALCIKRKLGIKPGEARVGRTVRYPLFLLGTKGWRILLKTCPSAKEAQSLSKEISNLIDVPVRDNSGESQNREKNLFQQKPLSKIHHQPYLNPGNTENYVRKHIVEIAEGEFPDNKGLEWIIHGFERENDLIYVEVEPVPSEVGYPRFKFVITSEKSRAVEVVAVYCLEEGGYSLLSSTSGFRKKLPKRLDLQGGRAKPRK